MNDFTVEMPRRQNVEPSRRYSSQTSKHGNRKSAPFGLFDFSILRLCLALGLLFLPWTASGSAQTGNPSDASGTSKARIDKILTDLQYRSDGMRDIRCRVRFVEDDKINLSKKTSFGRILFMITEPNPHFLIHFEKSEVDGVARRQEWVLFDGRWLYQGIERLKQVDQQEIVRAGEKIDMFDLESAPFPLPFGQKKEKILRNFDVTLVAPTATDPPGTNHLVCVPKPDSRLARRYDKLEFFILKDLHLPNRVVVTKNGGLEINTADFPGLYERSINTGLTRKDLAHPKEWKKEKYRFVVERLPPPEKASP